MRHTMLGLLVFAAACSRQPVSPTIPSDVPAAAGTQAAAQGRVPNVEVTFTKWVDPSFPTFAGVAGGMSQAPLRRMSSIELFSTTATL